MGNYINKQKEEPITEYLTHDNGGRKYKVVLTDLYVMIYNNITGDLVLKLDPVAYWIGRSVLNKGTCFSGGHGKEFDGNSFLIQTSDVDYVFVGNHIKRFKHSVPITNYSSPVGNNDVPYPYGTDENFDHLLMIENVIIKGKDFEEGEGKDYKQYTYEYDPYVMYYNTFKEHDDAEEVIKNKKEMAKELNIRKF